MSETPSTPVGKGRPTPKRSEAERHRRHGPVTPPPTTRKEAARRKKDLAVESRARVKAGASAGDERYLTKRDAGPVRALVRDTVDRRRNAGVLLLPLALLLVGAQITGNRRALDLAFSIWAAGLLLILLDTLIMVFSVTRGVREKHPGEGKLVGHVAYGLLRSTVLRRFRLPVPRVSPGKPKA